MSSMFVKKEQKYSADIDNSCNLINLDSVMFGALTGSKGQVVAVLQLANKSEITPDDELKLINLAGLIGVCIDGNLEVMESMSDGIKHNNSREGLTRMIE